MTQGAHYDQCQMLVEHHEPWSNLTRRCRRNTSTHRIITSGRGVYVCRQHAKQIDYRMGSSFFTTPDTFFAWEEE